MKEDSSDGRYNTNLAAEFYVLSMLYRLGFDASLTLGNKKAVDIVVVLEAGRSVTIDVKGLAGAHGWLMGGIPASPKANHFIVLLTFEGKMSDAKGQAPRCWVFRHEEILPLVKISKNPIGKQPMKYVSRKEVLTNFAHLEAAWYRLAGDKRPDAHRL
jgi:hypothetical protein